MAPPVEPTTIDWHDPAPTPTVEPRPSHTRADHSPGIEPPPRVARADRPHIIEPSPHTDPIVSRRRARAAAPSPTLSAMTPLLASAIGRRNQEPVVLALVGPTGAGKTTTIAKLARHPRVFRGLPVGLLCLDTYRVGAVEQLAIYADIARLPLQVVHEPGDLSRALRRLRGCEIVLVDTAGRGPAGRADSAETRAQLAALRPAEVHLTLPAGLDARHARRVIADHSDYGVTHLIATKLDEFPEDDTVFALADELGLPMRWTTNGQEVPMDLVSAAVAREDSAPITRQGAHGS